jgi:hypothetical protein
MELGFEFGDVVQRGTDFGLVEDVEAEDRALAA